MEKTKAGKEERKYNLGTKYSFLFQMELLGKTSLIV